MLLHFAVFKFLFLKNISLNSNDLSINILYCFRVNNYAFTMIFNCLCLDQMPISKLIFSHLCYNSSNFTHKLCFCYFFGLLPDSLLCILNFQLMRVLVNNISIFILKHLNIINCNSAIFLHNISSIGLYESIIFRHLNFSCFLAKNASIHILYCECLSCNHFVS